VFETNTNPDDSSAIPSNPYAPLPDLKSVLVCYSRHRCWHHDHPLNVNTFARFTDGSSATTESSSGTRIGVVLRRLVRSNLRVPPCQYNNSDTLAEGNPDEEKIGAFGVGEYSS